MSQPMMRSVPRHKCSPVAKIRAGCPDNAVGALRLRAQNDPHRAIAEQGGRDEHLDTGIVDAQAERAEIDRQEEHVCAGSMRVQAAPRATGRRPLRRSRTRRSAAARRRCGNPILSIRRASRLGTAMPVIVLTTRTSMSGYCQARRFQRHPARPVRADPARGGSRCPIRSSQPCGFRYHSCGSQA